jgi:glycosyltransferase involved in cell wall biosynthesis
MTDTPDVSVVIPCYNEAMNARPIAQAVIAQLEPLGISFDILFIDNGSTDDTVTIIKDMCAQDQRIRLIANTRNFGQMRSPTHGIYRATGRAVIGMCADFQDSPELLPHFVARWQAGVDIVLGVREAEKSGLVLTGIRSLSYWLARHFGDVQTIPNATGFGLYSRRVVDAIKALNEPEPFYRALLVETGFPLETIDYVRPPRAAGKSKNNFFTLLDFAVAGLTGSSKRLLRVPLYVGVLGAGDAAAAAGRGCGLLHRAADCPMADRRGVPDAVLDDLRLHGIDGRPYPPDFRTRRAARSGTRNRQHARRCVR